MRLFAVIAAASGFADFAISAYPLPARLAVRAQIDDVEMPPEFRDIVGVPSSWLEGIARMARLGN